MSLLSNIVINCFSIMLLITLLVHSSHGTDKGSLQHKLYSMMLFLTILLLLLDILSRFDGNPGTVYPFLNSIGNFMMFLLNPILPSLWFLYVNNQVYHDTERTRKLYLPILVLNAVNAVMVAVSQFTGWYYSIDSGNVYHRGPLFLLSAIITIYLLVTAFFIVWRKRKRINKRHLFSLLFFPVPPFVGILLQLQIYGISFILNFTALTLLVVLLNIQNDSIYTDYLTGIGNRKNLEAVLKEKISKVSPCRTFSLIMLDIDNFKEINDTFGHEMGDTALKASADLLKRCIRSTDYITRYGGDEFCLILEIYDIKSLNAVADRISCCVGQLNESGALPFKLDFSAGHAVYDYDAGLTVDEFLKQVDLLMYENKRIKKNAASDRAKQ